MAVYKAIPESFAKMHKRYLTPTVSTVAMGGVSILLYVVMNYLSAGQVIKDSVDSLGVMIAFYYGLTGFSCTWYYRKNLTSSVRNLFMQGILPTVGGLILFFILGWSFWYYWQPVNSYTHWGIFGRQIGGVFILDVGMLLLGVILMFTQQAFRPAFFRGETLNRNSATLVTEEYVAKQD
jgi:amino acid transporter